LPSYGFLGTYPPTQCGLATFSRALMGSLAPSGSADRAGIVRVMDMPVRSAAPEVVAHLHSHSPTSHREAAAALNTFDVVIVQYDHAIYGGHDGDQILAVLDLVRVPVVLVAHTVPAEPGIGQASVVQRAIAASDAVVAMSQVARRRLITLYQSDPTKVSVIGHGASPRLRGSGSASGQRPVILTWGLLGPGKGIEWAIDGLQRVQHLRPAPAYVVAGQTHPRVRLHEGERYRLKLAQRARTVGVGSLFRLMGSYLDEATLTRLIRCSDVILLPYDSRDQVTSGVLAEAVAAGKPVVATAFPHAVELLSGGAGLLVPQYDGAAIGAALLRVLTEPGLAAQMTSAADDLAPSLLWPAVADQYRSLTTAVLERRATVSGSVTA
jgi:polysaccharide biosynthesis protein PslF